MTMSHDYIWFRMLCFHVNQTRFMVSAGNFMKLLFLTYDVVRSYEYDREHVAACEGIPQSLHPDGGLYIHVSPGPLNACGGVLIRQRGPVHQVHRHHCKHGLDRHTSTSSCSRRSETLLRPTHLFSRVAAENASALGVHITTDDVVPSFVVLCAPLAAKIPNYRTTCGRSSKSFLVIRGLTSNAHNSVP